MRTPAPRYRRARGSRRDLGAARVPGPIAPAGTEGAVVLAAGASTRLGRPKQLLRFRGEPLVVRAVRAALDAGTAPVVVVLGAAVAPVHAALEAALAAELAGGSVLPVLHDGWADGISSSVGAGVRALLARAPATDGFLLTLADQPLVDAPALGRLLGAYRRYRAGADDGSREAGIAAAAYAGTLGVPAVFGRAYVGPLLRLSRSGRGASTLLRAAPPGALVRVALPEAAVDVDTPADVAHLPDGFEAATAAGARATRAAAHDA